MVWHLTPCDEWGAVVASEIPIQISPRAPHSRGHALSAWLLCFNGLCGFKSPSRRARHDGQRLCPEDRAWDREQALSVIELGGFAAPIHSAQALSMTSERPGTIFGTQLSSQCTL